MCPATVYRDPSKNKTLKALLTTVCMFLQGIRWYRTTKGVSGAWGFADGESDIFLYWTDSATSDGEKRISWSINMSGGVKCGTTDDLYSFSPISQYWEKVLYHAN